MHFPVCAYVPLLRPYMATKPIKVIIYHHLFINRDVLLALRRSVMTTAASEKFQSGEMVPSEQSLLFIALPFPASNALFFSFWDIMILIFHWLCLCWSAEQEADVSISRAAPGIHHQRSAQETDSFTLICICLVCQLGEHPHHPTHTVISD